jgi:DNA polymerase alpha-associated DNA helicase A
MNQTMTKLQKLPEAQYTTLIRVAFGLDSPTPLPPDLKSKDSGVGDIEFIDPSLNDSQIDAIRFAIASREVALIHGPPGVRAHFNA